MFKIRKNLFETNSSSTHSVSIQKLDNDGRIEPNKAVILCKNMEDSDAISEKDKLQFISCVLTALVEDYYDNTSKEYIEPDNNLYFSNIAFSPLKEVLQEEGNVELVYDNCRNPMPYDKSKGLDSYDILFGLFEFEGDNLEDRYLEYTKNMKPKIKEYIFGNYVLSSKDEEW